MSSLLRRVSSFYVPPIPNGCQHHILHQTPLTITPTPPKTSVLVRLRTICRSTLNDKEEKKMETRGLDSEGREFKNAEEMWKEEVGDLQKKAEWYQKGVGYWQGVEASNDGVLGGYAHVNEPDIKASEKFLNTLLPDRFPDAGRNRHLVALDCGSGIGRVTKNLLIRYFNEVDLLEPVPHFLEAARKNLAPENLMVSDTHKAANFYCVPLQEFTPDADRYDVIWVQWCIGHLADEDFISFFKRAKAGLKPGGFFVLKENTARSASQQIDYAIDGLAGAFHMSVTSAKLVLKFHDEEDTVALYCWRLEMGSPNKGFVLDKEDKSITRSDVYFKELFNQCGLYVYKSMDQKEFPSELFAVKMYALTTEMPKRSSSRPKRHANRPGVIR